MEVLKINGFLQFEENFMKHPKLPKFVFKLFPAIGELHLFKGKKHLGVFDIPKNNGELVEVIKEIREIK